MVKSVSPWPILHLLPIPAGCFNQVLSLQTRRKGRGVHVGAAAVTPAGC